MSEAETTPNFPYYNVVDQIIHAPWTLAKLGRLELIKECLGLLWPHGHPTRFVQVAGTSGKGSVCHFLEAGFGLSQRAGSLTSPHLFDYRQRFSINGQPPSQEHVVAAWEEVVLPFALQLARRGEAHTLSTIEVTILLALVLFERLDVRLAAIETGVGGRYDQTTALPVEAVALTNIGRDHEDLLGHEEWQRALDKAGICRPNVPFFSAVPDGEAANIVAAVCASRQAPLYRITSDDVARLRSLAESAEVPEGALLSGEHQYWNAALAAAILKHLLPEQTEADFVSAFASVTFPGRFQVVGERLIADIAHNPDKLGALASQIQEHFPTGRKIFVIGLSGKRSAQEAFQPILGLADRLIVTSAGYKGVAPETIASDLRALATPDVPIEVISDPRAALAAARARQGEHDVVILTGSTYMIDQCLNPDPYLRLINETFGWREAMRPEK